MAIQTILSYGAIPYLETGRIEWLPVAAAQTLAKGDFVIMDAAGRMTIALAASAALYGVCAAASAAQAVDTLIPVYVAHPEAQFIIRCSGTATEALKGALRDIEGATGAMLLNEDAGVTDVLQILRWYTDDGDAVGASTPGVIRVHLSQYAGTEV